MDEEKVEPSPVSENGNVKPLAYQDFCKMVEGRREQNCPAAIFSHASPDPDAIASMMGIQWILQRAFGLESQLFYAGEVSHPQNATMDNLLSPGLLRVDDHYNSDGHCLRILVDTVPGYAGVGNTDCRSRFDCVIDHHRDLPQNGYNKLMIHRKVGSCSAIVYDMMREIVPDDQWLKSESDIDSKLATALIAGIMVDTHFLMSDDCTELDRLAFNDLFEYRNSSFLNEIVFFKRRRFWVDRKAQACADAKVNEQGYAVVGLGLIPVKERDIISDMADEMITWATVETAIAFAVVAGDRIEGSVRSTDSSLSVADFCKKLGGRHGSGGGKLGKGAYQLPLAGFSIDPDEDDEDAQEAWESIRKREAKRIARIISE